MDATQDDPRRSPEGLQSPEDEDLGFGGWRDWLLVLVGAPIFLGALFTVAMLAIGSRGSATLLSPSGGLLVTAVAVVVGLVAGRSGWIRRGWS